MKRIVLLLLLALCLTGCGRYRGQRNTGCIAIGFVILGNHSGGRSCKSVSKSVAFSLADTVAFAVSDAGTVTGITGRALSAGAQCVGGWQKGG